MAAERGWRRKFDDPITLPDGRSWSRCGMLATTSVACQKKSAQPELQATIEALMLVVKQHGPTMFARIGMMQALHRGEVRE